MLHKHHHEDCCEHKWDHCRKCKVKYCVICGLEVPDNSPWYIPFTPIQIPTFRWDEPFYKVTCSNHNHT